MKSTIDTMKQALPGVAATAPTKIYLVVGEDCPADAYFGDLDLESVTWCADRIDANSIEYVRADHVVGVNKLVESGERKPLAPDDMVLVPVEPTDEMLDAAYTYPASTDNRMVKQYKAMLAAAQREALPAAEPYGWKVEGVSRLYTGEHGELDAKAEAAHCGGTCRAFPLYTVPQPSAPVGRRPMTEPEMANMVAGMGMYRGDWGTAIIRATEKHHEIGL